MSFFSYLYQLKISFTKFFDANASVAPGLEKTKYAEEAIADTRYNLRIKCKRAAQEIQYLRGFSHWPIAKAKKEIDGASLVYLDVSRTKRANVDYKNIDKDKVFSILDKSTLPNKIIKKIP